MARKLLLDIEALLDTRLGLLRQFGEEIALAVAQNPDYYARERDDWSVLTDGAVTTEAFNEAWEARDGTVLRASHQTGIHQFLDHLVGMYWQNLAEGLVEDDFVLVVNTHPYTLDTAEQNELAGILQHTLMPSIQVEFVRYSLSELTPMVLSEHFDALILYEMARWVRIQGFNFPKCPCKGLDVIGPRLWDKDPSGLTLEQKKMDIQKFQLLMLEWLPIDFIDPEYFSLELPPAKEETSSESTAPAS